MLDVHMAHAADDQGLALAGNHHSDPCGLFGPPSALQVFQGPDVVDLDVFVRAAELALVRQQSLLQVRPLVVPDGSRLIIENCIWTMLERHATPLSHQWRLACSLDRNPQARVVAFGCLERGPVPLVDLGNADLELGSQRLGQRRFHDPLQTVEAVQVERQPVVLDGTPILSLILRHDAEDAVVEPLWTVHWFAIDHVGGALLFDHVRGHTQAGDAVDAAMARPCACRVVLQDDHLIAQEVRGFSSRMSDQRLLLGKLQLERVMQERSNLTFDRLGF
jgi:hypothetical protein